MSRPARGTLGPGAVIGGKYRLEEELGKGGMGAVYRARHLKVLKDFAVKILRPELLDHRAIASRFFLEAQAAGRIGHPGILDVYDVGEDEDGTPYLVMELLRGETLAARMEQGPLPIATACWIARELLDVLDAAHRAGIVHRDVKPQNVFLVKTGSAGRRTVKLLDFGIAKFHVADASAITRSGEIIGSPLYMAPEQAKGESDVDARIDVWSVGAMLYEMLALTPAHAAPTPIAVLARILTETVTPPSSRRAGVTAAIDAVVLRALSIPREGRWPDAATMRQALGEACPEGASVPRFDTLAPSAVAIDPLARTETSPEPPLEAAVTQGAPKAPGPLLAVAALLALAGAASLPWLVGTGAPPVEPAAARPSGVAVPTGLSPNSAEPSAVPPPASTPTPSASASTTARPANTAASRPTPPIVPAPAVPSCAPAEVLSSGHCCPRGLVWQSAPNGGHCERPLATTF